MALARFRKALRFSSSTELKQHGTATASIRRFGIQVTALPSNLRLDSATTRYLLRQQAQTVSAPPPTVSGGLRSLPVLSLATGFPTGAVVSLDSRVFDTPLRTDIVHRVVIWQEKNARTTLYKAKTRSEVRGGGRKPWKQKGTGRARQGSIRSPLWKGGGVAHGAVFRDWSISLNKKVRQLGLRVVVAAKARDRRLLVVESLEMGSSKTGLLSKALMAQGLGLPPVGRKRLVFIDADDLMPDNFLLAVRNLPLSKPLPVRGVNVRDLVKADSVVITTAGLAQLTERLTHGLAQLIPPPALLAPSFVSVA